MKRETGDMGNIEFSVVIPLYNKERSIRSTIESVLSQTYPNFELIIVNDGSTDNSLQVVQSFNDSRIIIYNKPNGGVSSARNLGIQQSKNDYVVFLDADDFWFPFCLDEFCRLINAFPDAEVFCTNYNMTGKNLKGSDRIYLVDDYYYTSAYFLAKWSIPIMLTGCLAIKRNLFAEVGDFNENITHGEDVDMWQRLANRYKLAKSEKVTTIYRTETENRASLLDEKLKRKAELNQSAKTGALSKSEKLYYGVESALELKSCITSGTNFQSLGKQLKNLSWLIRGMLFIFKIRILNIPSSPTIKAGKCLN